jgi:hypothetical protein
VFTDGSDHHAQRTQLGRRVKAKVGAVYWGYQLESRFDGHTKSHQYRLVSVGDTVVRGLTEVPQEAPQELLQSDQTIAEAAGVAGVLQGSVKAKKLSMQTAGREGQPPQVPHPPQHSKKYGVPMRVVHAGGGGGGGSHPEEPDDAYVPDEFVIDTEYVTLDDNGEPIRVRVNHGTGRAVRVDEDGE